jgi:hypothetical protein
MDPADGGVIVPHWLSMSGRCGQPERYVWEFMSIDRRPGGG